MTRIGFLAALLAGHALAFSVATDSQGDVVRWRTRVEFVLDERFAAQLGLPEAAADAVASALAAYDAQTAALAVSMRRGATGAPGYSTEPGARNQSDIVVLRDWPYSSAGLATTLVTVNARTNEILDADIAFNADSYEFALVDVPRGDERTYDVRNTVMHELGHALGLQHNAEDPEVVMYPSSAPQETVKRHLAPDDVAGLTELYGVDAFAHPELAAGCSAAPGSQLTSWLALAAALWTLVRRARVAGRVAVVGLVALAGGARASEPSATRAMAPPEEVAWAEVVDTQSRWLPGAGIIVTDVEVEVRACERGECPRGRVVVQVLGGRVGDIEQHVAHAPPVQRGARVLLVKQGGRRRLVPTTLGVVVPPGVTPRAR